MRVLRDILLVVCAVISTSCLVYVYLSIEAVNIALRNPSALTKVLMELMPDDSPESAILKRLKNKQK
jgi:hypothetical protein